MGTSSKATVSVLRHRSVRALQLVLLIVVLAVGWTLLFGIPLDLGAQRASVARMLSSQIGRSVQLDGALQLRIGLRPRLFVGDLRIAQPEGFGVGDFLRMGAAEVNLDLMPLLRRQFRADRLQARDVWLDLVQREDGAGNWTFGSDTALPDPVVPEDADAGLRAEDVAGIDIREIDIDNVTVVYRGGTAPAREFHLDRLDAALPIGSGVTLRASGKVERTMPYALAIDGGELRALLRGQRGWPVSLQLDFAGGRLAAQGQLGGDDSELRFGLGAPDLATFGKVIGVALPDAGAAGLSGNAHFGPGFVRVTGLSASLGKSVMAGWLELDARSERPRLSGALGVQTLDLRPFLGQQDDDEEPTDLAALYRSLATAKVDLQALGRIDAGLQLGVNQWLGIPGDIRGASLQLQLQQGQLRIPVQATVESVPMQGQLEVDAAAQSLALRFRAADSPIGGLARFLTGIPGIDGQLGSLELALTASGSRGDELMRSMTTSMTVTRSRLSYGNRAGSGIGIDADQGVGSAGNAGNAGNAGKGGDGSHRGSVANAGRGSERPVEFTLERMRFSVGGTRALAGELDGSLLGQPLKAALSGDSLMAMLAQGGSPVALTDRKSVV